MITESLRSVEAAARNLEEHIETWFNKTMDRVSERFKVHTRLWAVAFSVIAAFGLQLDVLELYDKISTDSV